ncbi:ABC transporter ATP-binding protein [Levilactobacillus bambusae]|uniref:Macrolide ABC transporter ATP-binding protein n=1 Tax=Levilactobacillus bambusae TaxID=2024736 RepID=A0A2V1MZM3_9LACO|nr:ABC transporter ATP-binding protein [Levilactobacillus bambusae]PWG00213.1 macrolide ABC transporter ATP-binding protein [Levilactobacillus bambusae]
MSDFIVVKDLTKTYGSGENAVTANKDISFTIPKGELTIIVGESGAGKSTLLDILGGMDTATSGQVVVAGQDLSHATNRQLTTYRRHEIGFVFQFYNLVPNLTAVENVQLASEIAPDALDPVTTLQNVGLGERLNNFPAQLSGGEQQRVAIARAIAKNPLLLLCDEPTGALDYQTGKHVLKLIQDFAHQSGKNAIIVTHNGLIKPMADHVLEIVDGKIKEESFNAHPVSVETLEW